MYEVVVGSKLHGLATPESDTDIKGIYVASLADVIDPWTNLDRAKTDGPDKTYYELSHFARLLASCNPTVLEVAYSPLVLQHDSLVEEVLAYKHEVLDAKRIKDACIGYAQSQLNKLDKLEGKRKNKAMVAAFRMYMMADDLLRTRNFNPVLGDQDRTKLMDIKENGLPVDEFKRVAGYWVNHINFFPADFRGDLTNIKQTIYEAYTKGNA